MNSPFGHDASNTMTKKNNKNVKKDVKRLERDFKKTKIKASTPFADVGGVVAKAAGSLFGIPDASKIGRWLGSGIGSIFGSGDYEIAGNKPKYNVLAGSPPKFSTSNATNVVCHREYLGDIIGGAAFDNRIYPINPGVATTFPWLSQIAANYQQYRLHGMVFEFKPLITDFIASGQPGVVVMSTNYNADAPDYTSRYQMENAEFAVAVKPTNALMHMIECEPSQTSINEKYVRNGDVPATEDLRLYDHGNFQLASQANPNIDLGELWVTYCVEFLKPVVTINAQNRGFVCHRTGITNSLPLGDTQVKLTGNLEPAIRSNDITVQLVPGNSYLLEFIWYTSSVAWSPPGLGFTGVVGKQYLLDNTQSEVVSPQSGVTCTSASLSFTFEVDSESNGLIAFAVASMVIGAGSVDIILTTLPPNVA